MPSTQPNRLKVKAENAGVTVLELVMAAVVSEGSKQAAARKLECSPTTIDYHLKKAGIKPQHRQSIVFVPAVQS